MALTWDLTEVENPDEVCWIKSEDGSYMSSVTNAIIWRTMGVDIGHITSETAALFYARSKMLDKIDGFMIHDKENPNGRSITAEEIEQHIGLRTNVRDVLSDKKWGSRIMEYGLNRWMCDYRRAAEKQVA